MTIYQRSGPGPAELWFWGITASLISIMGWIMIQWTTLQVLFQPPVVTSLPLGSVSLGGGSVVPPALPAHHSALALLGLGVFLIGLGLKLKTADWAAQYKRRGRAVWVVLTLFFGWLALLILAALPRASALSTDLGELILMHASGQLSDQEFAQAKARLLAP